MLFIIFEFSRIQGNVIQADWVQSIPGQTSGAWNGRRNGHLSRLLRLEPYSEQQLSGESLQWCERADACRHIVHAMDYPMADDYQTASVRTGARSTGPTVSVQSSFGDQSVPSGHTGTCLSWIYFRKCW